MLVLSLALDKFLSFYILILEFTTENWMSKNIETERNEIMHF